MYFCYAHGWSSHDRLCPSCFVEHTWSGTNATGTLVIEDSDKMESLLEEIETLRAQMLSLEEESIKLRSEVDRYRSQLAIARDGLQKHSGSCVGVKEYEGILFPCEVCESLAQLSVEPKKVGK